MILNYVPKEKITINDAVLNFFEHRDFIRAKLPKTYKEDNQLVEFGQQYESILVRRDIYQGRDTSDYLFFLDYDKDDLFAEIEVIKCEKIVVLDISFDFNDELDEIALKFEKYSDLTILSDGEYFFKDLRIVLSNKWKRGGEGSTIGYFYCAHDISHI
jgi:hypothetical protein